MTGLDVRPWRLPVVHWPSVRGRARADAGPLALVGVVVAVVAVLAGAVPPLLRATAQHAVEDAVRQAGGDAELAVSPPWDPDYGPNGGRVRDPGLAAAVDGLKDAAAAALDPRLRAVLRAPTAVVSGPRLDVTDGSVLRTFRLTYLAAANDGPRVTWIAGGPPRAAPQADTGDLNVHVEMPLDGPPWPVQVGLSEVDASALHVRPGDRIPLEDDAKTVKNVVVSGIFRAFDDADPAWRLAPWLLKPVAGLDGAGSTRLGGLLSPDSLPDARLAFEWDQLDRTVRFTPDPVALSKQSTSELGGILLRLKAASGSSSGFDNGLKWQTQLDAVLRKVESRVAAATAQASVLLIGVLTAAILVLLLAAELLVRRRAPALAIIRWRGAGLPDVGLELMLESAAVALAGAALGLGVARMLAPGVAWGWAVPIVVAAAAAAPGFGMLAAARSTGGRRVPANRSARRWHQRTAQLRRGAVEAALLAGAVVALVALHQRGVLPAGAAGAAVGGAESTQDGGGALPASAPALGILAAALLLMRLLPGGTGLVLRQALRARGSLAVFGASRAAATAARVLPPLALTASAALACFALTVHATADRGVADGAWRTVGADARLDVAPDAVADTAALARRIAGAPGVRQVVTAQVTDRARVIADDRAVAPRLVIVAAADLQRLFADTPLPDVPALARLGLAGSGDIPALVRSNGGSLHPGMRLELPRTEGRNIRLIAVGTAPAVGDAEDVVVVDAAAMSAAGMPVVPNTLWVTGPGAARAATGSAGTTVLLTDVQRDRRTAPLAAALLWLAWVSAATMLALGLLGLAVGAATSAPDRWLTLTRLRTLGLRPRDARWVSAAELLPMVLVAAVAGPLLGTLLVRLTLGSLDLALLTGQASTPTLVLPWWEFGGVIAALAAAFAVVVPVESAVRRRRRLSEVLRAGG